MPKAIEHSTIARWFFLLLSLAVLYLYWRVTQPFILVLVTAGVFAVLLTPVERRLRSWLKHPKLSALIVVLVVAAAIVLPLVTIGLVMVRQASVLLSDGTLSNLGWISTFRVQDLAIFQVLPGVVQEELLKIDLVQAVKNAASLVSGNITVYLASSLDFMFKTFIFFVCLFYMLFDRERIVENLVELSPMRDKIDRRIMGRIVGTIRSVILGSLTVALVQGVIAAIGLTIFGVPAPLVWAGLVVIAANVPMVGTGVIMIPAIVYLFLTGDVGNAIGLTIWSGVAVGTVDNILQPFIVGGRTKMNALLILLSMLGGLQAFGPIGFILGPTILASFLIIIELYKSGILEKQNM